MCIDPKDKIPNNRVDQTVFLSICSITICHLTYDIVIVLSLFYPSKKKQEKKKERPVKNFALSKFYFMKNHQKFNKLLYY